MNENLENLQHYNYSVVIENDLDYIDRKKSSKIDFIN